MHPFSDSFGDEDSEAGEEREARREELGRRLAEKDRYVRAYAQEHISEAEPERCLAELKNQTCNIRLLLDSVEADLSQKRERMELTETTRAWLAVLRRR